MNILVQIYLNILKYFGISEYYSYIERQPEVKDIILAQPCHAQILQQCAPAQELGPYYPALGRGARLGCKHPVL